MNNPFTISKSRSVLGPTEHSGNCRQWRMEWQEQILPGTPLLGRCINCGAVAIDRTSQANRVPAGNDSRYGATTTAKAETE